MGSRVWRLVASMVVLAMVVAGCAPRGNGTAPGGATAGLEGAGRAGVAAGLAKVPLLFVENRGQLAPSVAYYVPGRDTSVYFTPGGLTFALTGSGAATAAVTERGTDPAGADPGRERWALKLDFVGADAAVAPVGRDATAATVSYFKGDEAEWKTALPTYGGLMYENLWPGIDLQYAGTQDRLKYQFVVKPGADPGAVKLAYRGATSVAIGDGGELRVATPVGGFDDEAPYAYQDTEAGRVEVASAYALATDGGHAYGFDVGSYDATRELVLDPAVLVYAGFLGGAADEVGRGIAVDSAGNAYVTGETSSSEATFPETAGSFGPTFQGTRDAFVAKVNPAGSALVYAAFLGGSDDDEGRAIAVDAGGNAYVTGTTSSAAATFPDTMGAFDQTPNGGADAFIAKVNPTGTALVYATFVGSGGGDFGRAIAVDSVGNAYITGQTTAATFPVSMGAFDTTFGAGGGDAFVFKLDAAGAARVYATFLGGAGVDQGTGIAVDAAGNAYVTGFTSSTEATFPATPGAFDGTANGGIDTFVTKLNPAGSAQLYSTYLGGAQDDLGSAIAIDGGGNAYVVGNTQSDQTTFPETAGAFDVTANGGTDGFVAKVNPAGTALVYASFLGGGAQDDANGVAVDGTGNAYVTGFTQSSEATFPATADAFDPTFNGGGDAFVVKVNPGGTALVYATYLGGEGNDGAQAIALDPTGNAYVTGSTNSQAASFPETTGAFGTTPGGVFDAFVAKISESTAPTTINANLGLTVTDAPDPVARNGALVYTAVVTNGGPTAAPQTRIILKLPASVNFTSGTVTGGGTCAFESAAARNKPQGRILCPVGDLANGASATATITVSPTASGVLGGVARAKLSPPTADPVAANSELALNTTVSP